MSTGPAAACWSTASRSSARTGPSSAARAHRRSAAAGPTTPTSSPFRLVAGRGPARAGEVAVDTQTASKAGLSVGSTVELTTPGPTLHDTVVGVFRFGTTGNLAGASIVAFDVRTAQQVLLQGADAYTQVSARASPGVSQGTLRARVAAALGPRALRTLDVRTGRAAADQQAQRITDNLKFFGYFLLAFAGIALVVGSFIILNTFTMLVAQRTRELALLRAVGASRGQVTRSVLLEAAVVGVVGSTRGTGSGRAALGRAARAVRRPRSRPARPGRSC